MRLVVLALCLMPWVAFAQEDAARSDRIVAERHEYARKVLGNDANAESRLIPKTGQLEGSFYLTGRGEAIPVPRRVAVALELLKPLLRTLEVPSEYRLYWVPAWEGAEFSYIQVFYLAIPIGGGALLEGAQWRVDFNYEDGRVERLAGEIPAFPPGAAIAARQDVLPVDHVRGIVERRSGAKVTGKIQKWIDREGRLVYEVRTPDTIYRVDARNGAELMAASTWIP